MSDTGATPSEFLCAHHQHEWAGLIADDEGVFFEVLHRDRNVAVRKVLDELVLYIPFHRLPRPAEMKDLEPVERTAGPGAKNYGVWIERHCRIEV